MSSFSSGSEKTGYTPMAAQTFIWLGAVVIGACDSYIDRNNSVEKANLHFQKRPQMGRLLPLSTEDIWSQDWHKGARSGRW